MYSMEDSVKAGIELLDKKGLANWRERIDISILKMHSTRFCVLGQIYGSLYDGSKTLGLVNDKGECPELYKYGFNIHEPIQNFDILADEWRRQLGEPNN